MAGKKNQVTLTFAGDTAQLEKAFDQVGKGAGNLEKDLESNSDKFSKWNKRAVIASTAVVGAGAAVATSLVNAGREGIKADKALEQVFTSMGGAGSEAFGQATDAANEFSAAIGRPATDITEVQTKLATFGNVWNDPIAGAENFNRATMLAFDLEAAGFGSAEGNVAQLGRALEDPIQGMTALTRAGVSFSEAEKEKIRQLQESGDLLGAQEMVYQALEKQVGGVAEATTDGGERMAAQWANLQDQLGRQLLPVFEQLMAIGQEVLTWASENGDTLLVLGGIVVGLAGFVLTANLAWKIYTATTKAVTLATKAFTVAQKALNLAMRMNPIGLIITLVAALVAGIVIAYKRSETFRNIVQGAMRGIQKAFGWVIDRGKDLIGWFKNLPTTIRNAISTLADIIRRPFRSALDGIKSIWNNTIGKISFSIPSWVPGVGGKGFSFPRMHFGGIVPGAPGSDVPTILQAGERVVPRGQTGRGAVIELRSSGSPLDDMLLEILRHAIRVQGGDVQVVLGT